ncbi:sugar transporter [Algimonas arctica]|uniref:Sugar transporter n=1 Tax=Algimonas arctica TaxID=1479486 RepID=A0A8J3G3Q4_9PROT|nr:exopolysaccharide biosynthesis protein [Algimonas arctica]GHB04789.1 sugar transporter [Algimonas arctica]
MKNEDQDHQEWTRKKTSQIMIELSDLSQEDAISLELMLRYLRGRAFGMVMILMAILSLLPNLFGHAILTGLLLLILGVQMAMGLSEVKLPKKVLAYSFSRTKIKSVMYKTAPKIAKIEAVLKPRFVFMTEDLGRRLIGAVIIPLSVLIMLPFPLTNFWPALCILVLSLGIIEKDGLAVAIGLIMSLGAVLVVNQIIKILIS